MPRLIHTYRYDLTIGERHLSEVIATVAERAGGTRRWFVTADNQTLEEEVARELFPNIAGRYNVPTFTLKIADRREEDADGYEQIRRESAGLDATRSVPRPGI